MRRIQAGKATKAKEADVDLYLKYTGKLPVEYITKDYARTHGWKSIKGNLSDVLPGKVIGGDIYCYSFLMIITKLFMKSIDRRLLWNRIK